MSQPKMHRDAATAYAANHSLRLHPSQQQLIEATSRVPMCIMMGSPDELQLLQNLCHSIRARKTLDIGVFTGYSALTIALALPDDGYVVACDLTDEYTKVGEPFWRQAGVEHKIRFVKGPAAETLQGLVERGEAGTFDFAFIDADKTGYDAYYELCLQLLRPGGIIALDNMLWSDTVLDPAANTPDVVSLREVTNKIHHDDRVHVSFLTIGDGTILAFKK